MRKIIALAVLVLLVTAMQAFPVDFKLEKVKLQEDLLIKVSLTICLTEDNLLIVLDAKAGNVKIYDIGSGKLEKVIGRKGIGPNEFCKPLFGYYGDRKLFVADVDLSKIFIYERTNRLDFLFKKGFFSPDVGNAHYYKDDHLYIAGSWQDKDDMYYSFFAMNLEKKGDIAKLLPSYLYYGLNSNDKYKKEIFGKPDLSVIGGLSCLDTLGDFAYLMWGGDLKVFKINLATKEIVSFGQKTPYYVKPYASNKLINAFADREAGAKTRAIERKKLSYILQVFTAKNHVLVIYEARSEDSEDLGFMMQFYTLEGDFIKEVFLPKILGRAMCFDKKSNTLYSHIVESISEEDEANYLVKCKIPITEILK